MRALLAVVVVLAGCASQSAPTDAASSDTLACDWGNDMGVVAGCPCTVAGQIVCGARSDFVCSGGVWGWAADACGEMDANVHPDAGVDASP